MFASTSEVVFSPSKGMYLNTLGVNHWRKASKRVSPGQGEANPQRGEVALCRMGYILRNLKGALGEFSPGLAVQNESVRFCNRGQLSVASKGVGREWRLLLRVCGLVSERFVKSKLGNVFSG